MISTIQCRNRFWASDLGRSQWIRRIWMVTYLYQAATASTIVGSDANLCRRFGTTRDSGRFSFHLFVDLAAVGQLCAFYPRVDVSVAIPNAWLIKYGSIGCVIAAQKMNQSVVKCNFAWICSNVLCVQSKQNAFAGHILVGKSRFKWGVNTRMN